MKKVAAPPDDVAASLRAITRDAKRLDDDYRWAHNHAYGPVASPIQPGRPSGPSDPTGTSIESAAKLSARSAVSEAARQIDAAQKALGVASRRLHQALGGKQMRPIGELGTEDPIVTKDDLGAARAAQERRRDRGESWGEA